MPNKSMALLMLTLATTFAPVAAEGDGPLAVVAGLARAFNGHDAAAMVTHVTDDVGWYSIRGASLTVEAKGKASLREAMASYFVSVPTVRSEIEASMVSGNYVVVRERVFWVRDGKEVSQSALAVYHVSDGLVASVWYYPAEK